MGDLFHSNVFQGFCLGGVSEWQQRSLPCHWGGQHAEVTLGCVKGSAQGGEPVGKSLKEFLKDVAENRRKRRRGHLSSERGGCGRQEVVGMQQQSSGGRCRAMAAVVPGLPKGSTAKPGKGTARRRWQQSSL